MATAKTTEARGKTKATIDHDEIRQWVERHGGSPAVVKRTRRGDDPGILRIDFPGFSGEDSLEHVDWDEFFEKFEEANLAFVYQDETVSGRPSRFNKLVSRDSVELGEAAEEGPPSGPRRASAPGRRTKVPVVAAAAGARRKKAASRGRAGRAGAKTVSRSKPRGAKRAAKPGARSTGRARAKAAPRATARTRAKARPGARATGTRGTRSRKTSRARRASKG